MGDGQPKHPDSTSAPIPAAGTPSWGTLFRLPIALLLVWMVASLVLPGWLRMQRMEVTRDIIHIVNPGRDALG